MKNLKQNSSNKYLPYFNWYYDFMGNTHYINDGNQDLIDLDFVKPGNPPEKNEQPLYIIPYKNRFGNNPHPRNSKNITLNKLADINISFKKN